MEVDKTVRLAVVEDEPLFRDLLCHACSSCNGIDVWANLSSGEDLIAAMDKLVSDDKEPPIDVLLTDIALGRGLNGFQIGYRLRQSHPNLGVLLLSNHCMPAYLSKLGTFGMHSFAYLLKTTATDFEALRRAILAIAQGRVLIDHAILSQGELHERLEQLTERQIEILHLVTQGYSNLALAQSLHLSPRTVENHLANIYDALRITNDGTVQPRVRAVMMYVSARFPHLMQDINPFEKGTTREVLP